MFEVVCCRAQQVSIFEVTCYRALQVSIHDSVYWTRSQHHYCRMEVDGTSFAVSSDLADSPPRYPRYSHLLGTDQKNHLSQPNLHSRDGGYQECQQLWQVDMVIQKIPLLVNDAKSDHPEEDLPYL